MMALAAKLTWKNDKEFIANYEICFLNDRLQQNDLKSENNRGPFARWRPFTN